MKDVFIIIINKIIKAIHVEYSFRMYRDYKENHHLGGGYQLYWIFLVPKMYITYII